MTNNPLFKTGMYCFTQAVMNLNTLGASILNPKILAYTYNFVDYDFNTTLIAPTDKKVVIHSKPDQRLTWDLNGETGWYVGP